MPLSAQKKNRTGSEGGEKARYPSPVVGTKIKKERRILPNQCGAYSANSRLTLIMRLLYHNQPGSTREIFGKNTVFFIFFGVGPANLMLKITRFKAYSRFWAADKVCV